MSSKSPANEAETLLLGISIMARKHEAKPSDRQISPPGKHLGTGKRTAPRRQVSKIGSDVAASLALQLLDGFVPQLLLDLLSICGTDPTRSTARAESAGRLDVAMKKGVATTYGVGLHSLRYPP